MVCKKWQHTISKLAEGLFWPQKIYTYGLRVAKLEPNPGLQTSHSLPFPLHQGKLLSGVGQENTLKNNPESL